MSLSIVWEGGDTKPECNRISVAFKCELDSCTASNLFSSSYYITLLFIYLFCWYAKQESYFIPHTTTVAVISFRCIQLKKTNYTAIKKAMKIEWRK